MHTDETKKLPLAQAIRGGLSADEPDAAEIERRGKVKDALLELIAAVDRGLFVSCVYTTLAEAEGKTAYVTAMLGDVDIIKATSAQVVEHYIKKDRKEEQEAVFMPPEPQLYIPGE